MPGLESAPVENRNWTPWIVLGGIALAAVLVVLWGVSAYNRMVTLREGIPAAWAQVENVLQRRYDLIPNLVSTVKGYAKHEKDLLTEVTKLRSQWGAAKTPAAKVAASNALEGALSRLMVVVEQYPNLKANEGFLKLQDELAGTENRIAVERMRYNEMVRSYNTTVQRFPSSLIANRYGFEKMEEAYFKMDKEAAKAPKVDF
jgi:LemA protein